MPFTGIAGDDVKFYAPTKMSEGFFTKTNCDFTASQSKFGASSLEFTGASSKLSAKTGYTVGESVGSASSYNYTISCFVRASRVDLAFQGIFAESGSHAVVFKNNTIVYHGGSSLITSPTIVANQWYHVALCKSGSTVNLYIDGVAASAGITRSVFFPVNFIGGTSASLEGLAGFINDFKYENVALYSGNFTPPSAAMTLDLYNPTFKKFDPYFKLATFAAISKTSKKIGAILLQEVYHFGPGHIIGTVKESHLPTDIPLSRRVRLYRKADGLLVDEVWSDALGNYAFTNIAIQKYYVIAFDHTNTYNAVIKDSITPEI